MENMKEQLMEIFDRYLKYAIDIPELVDIWTSQAYGALTLYCECICEENPEAEIEIGDYWNNIIHPKFIEIKMKGN